MTLLEILITITILILTAGFVLLAVVSIREKHHRAARLGFLFAILSILFGIAVYFSPQWVQITFTGLLGTAFLISLILVFWPPRSVIQPSPHPNAQVDERTILFARALLQPSTPQFDAYYQDHPDHLPLDNAFRNQPGLLTPGASFYDDFLAASPLGSFFLTEQLRDAVDGPIAPRTISGPPEKHTKFIKDLAHYHGAVDVGICYLKPYHIYSHIGRGSGEYGAPISLDHQFAIAFTVEMSHEMINTAPQLPGVMESAKQYVESAKIAVQLAAAIRQFGYPARAHIDGNYRVIAPLVAKDAGLGEIGRMGLLMTPGLGPRVRLGVVTTDLPLCIDQPTFNPSVIDFCLHCQKCAAVCPSSAIPFGDRQVYEDGTFRWKINAERCYTYWTKIGTDCGRCMAVCPYAHPDAFLHNLIRFGVNHSSNFRRAAIVMDDLFYGVKPRPHAYPDWLEDLKSQPKK